MFTNDGEREDEEISRAKAYRILKAQRKLKQIHALQEVIGQTLNSWDGERGGESDLTCLEIAEATEHAIQIFLGGE